MFRCYVRASRINAVAQYRYPTDYACLDELTANGEHPTPRVARGNPQLLMYRLTNGPIFFKSSIHYQNLNLRTTRRNKECACNTRNNFSIRVFW